MTVTPFSSRIGSAAGVGRAVGALGEDPARTWPALRGRDLALERGEHQDVDVERRTALVGDRARAGRAGDGAVLRKLPREVRDVEAVRVVGAAADVGDRDDPRAALVEQAGGGLADVAEALHGDAWRRSGRGRSGAAASSIV